MTSDNRDYYQILGVPKDAPAKEIKRAYHRLARTFHPDKASDEEQQHKYEEEFALISQAYNHLKDKKKKAEYDKTLKTSGPSSPSVALVQKSAPSAPKAADPRAAQRKSEVAGRAFRKGLILYQSGNYARSIEFFEAAISYNDEVAEYYMRYAQALAKAHRSISKAIESCQKAIDLDPWNVDCKFALGEVYEIAGIRSLAISTYGELLKWDEHHYKAREKLDALEGKTKGAFSFFRSIFSKSKPPSIK